MAVNFDDIATLAAAIGPRPPGSPYERRAAHYVVERLREMGIASTLLPVRVPRSFSLIYVTIFAIAVVSVPLARLSEILGFALGAIALVLFALEVAGTPVLSRLSAARGSHNALGLIPAHRSGARVRGDDSRRVIISAHLDTARSGLIWKPSLVRWYPALAMLVFGSLVAIALLELVSLFTSTTIPWLLSLIPLVVLVLALLLLFERDLRGRPVAGANDGASGVAAALAVAKALKDARPAMLETWVLFTAGQEAGLAGMTQFLNENRFDPERTYFINVASVGAGSVRYSRGEGLLIPRRSSPVLIRVAGDVARQYPEWKVQPETYRLTPTNQYAALAHGYQAIGIFATDDRGLVPNWHQSSDTIERIDAATVETASRLVLEMIRQLDSEILAAASERRHGPRAASPGS